MIFNYKTKWIIQTICGHDAWTKYTLDDNGIWGLDIEGEILRVLAQEITVEIDKEILKSFNMNEYL